MERISAELAIFQLSICDPFLSRPNFSFKKEKKKEKKKKKRRASQRTLHDPISAYLFTAHLFPPNQTSSKRNKYLSLYSQPSASFCTQPERPDVRVRFYASACSPFPPFAPPHTRPAYLHTYIFSSVRRTFPSSFLFFHFLPLRSTL